jgi:hypothetical protein
MRLVVHLHFSKESLQTPEDFVQWLAQNLQEHLEGEHEWFPELCPPVEAVRVESSGGHTAVDICAKAVEALFRLTPEAPRTRASLAPEITYSTTTLDRALRILEDRGVLSRARRGEYRLMPPPPLAPQNPGEWIGHEDDSGSRSNE